jgi:hypothetical protein
VKTAKESTHKDTPPAPRERIEIKGDDEPPVVKSSKPVDRDN